MAETTATGEKLLTRFYIYWSDDEGETANLMGTVPAESAATALRNAAKELNVNMSDDRYWYTAVSENSMKWRQPRTTFGDVTAAVTGGEEPEPTQEPTAPQLEV